MSENKMDQNSGLKDILLKNRNAMIIAVIIVALLIAVIPIVITQFTNGEDTVSDIPDTGKELSGTYALEIANAGSSKYIFDGNKVTNVYNDTTVEYTYVIAREGGVDVIKLTTVDEDGVQKTTTHEFYEGAMGDRAFISINDSYYYLQENAE